MRAPTCEACLETFRGETVNALKAAIVDAGFTLSPTLERAS
jgi:hypothetical protein